MALRLRTVDKGARALLKRLGEKPLRVKVGVFGDVGAQAATDGNGLTVGEVADMHEHHIPAGAPRAPIRRTVDAHESEIRTALKRGAAAVFKGQLTAHQALDLIGFKIVGWIQQEIANGIAPPLSASYLPRKLRKYPGATVPLIASGQLRRSYAHAVVPADEVD
jgi:hypothetical protein